MSLAKHMLALATELDRVHPAGIADYSLWPRDKLPNFNTARNGQMRLFTEAALRALGEVASLLYENDPAWQKAADRPAFLTVVRQCVSDLHAEGAFDSADGDDARSARKALRSLLQERLSEHTPLLVHHIPCWTLGMDKGPAFQLGPVTIRNREQWIDENDFQPRLYSLLAPDDGERDAGWREALKRALASDARPAQVLAAGLFDALRNCPSVATISVSGYERTESRKVAEIACKAALDVLSLATGAGARFSQQALVDDRVEPLQWRHIIGTADGLGLTGTGITKRVARINAQSAINVLGEITDYLTAAARMLHVLVDGTAHPFPGLANRWLTALEWLAEGSRERNDAIAVAKLASSLDVLSSGGKAAGITDLLANLLRHPKDKLLIQGPRNRTLAQAVSDIYEYGRSQILHGTHHERLKRFSELRQMCELLVPEALYVSALRLQTYSGPDEPEAFRTMLPSPSEDDFGSD